MQMVSEKWKSVQKKSLLNESFVEVSLDVADPDALADASPSDNGAIYISDSSKLTNGVDKTPSRYCTLEQNLWLLNGSGQMLPESDVEDNGYVGDVLSDESCVFSSKIPTITIEFSRVFIDPIPGITITWSDTHNEFADSFIVEAHLYNGKVVTREIEGNRSVTSVVMMDIVDYHRIVIRIKKWCLPYHRARVEKILVGVHKVYSKSNLISYSHKQSVDPVSTSLPKSEIAFSIDNTNNDYNPYNPQGMSRYLMERQEIKTRYGLKLNDGTIEWIKGGTFYLSEWEAKQNGMSADFKARDLLEFMSSIYYDTVAELTERSLYNLATMVLQSAKLPLNEDGTVKWIIDESLKEITTTAPLPEDTMANCLQLIANAGECVIYQDREGTLHIEPLSYDEDEPLPYEYEINSFNSYSKAELTLSKPVRRIRCNVYTYTIGDNGIENTYVTHDYPEEDEEEDGKGELITIDNPLITSHGRASSVGKWLYTHLIQRMTLDLSWRPDVRLDALDIVTNPNDYTTNRVRMTEVEFKYNGAFRGTGKGKVI